MEHVNAVDEFANSIEEGWYLSCLTCTYYVEYHITNTMPTTTSYVANRIQGVVCDATLSVLDIIESGVLQGSVLVISDLCKLPRNWLQIYCKILCWWHHAVLNGKRSCNICKYFESWSRRYSSVDLPMEFGVQPWPQSASYWTIVFLYEVNSKQVTKVTEQ